MRGIFNNISEHKPDWIRSNLNGQTLKEIIQVSKKELSWEKLKAWEKLKSIFHGRKIENYLYISGFMGGMQ